MRCISLKQNMAISATVWASSSLPILANKRTLQFLRILNLIRNMLISIRIRLILLETIILMMAERPLQNFSVRLVWIPVVSLFDMVMKAVWIKTVLWRFAAGFLTLTSEKATMHRYAYWLMAITT